MAVTNSDDIILMIPKQICHYYKVFQIEIITQFCVSTAHVYRPESH